MDTANCSVAEGLVSRSYIEQGSQALSTHRKLIKTLLSQRRLPATGWTDATIELLLQEVSLMDSNNFLDNVGVGEREARVASELVARRHYRMAHGIGRSGEIGAEQPKAAGSSLLLKITAALTEDALRIAGLHDISPALVLPVATGMALTLSMLALRGTIPPTARYVLWPRIDQKTCLKCITAAGFEPLPLPLRLCGDQLETDLEALEAQIHAVGAHSIACVLTTTSCFAPRAADDVVGVAKLCGLHGLPHIINNAYGVQSAVLCATVTAAGRRGRVDCVVQSTDKNFMTPVGGAILVAPKARPALVERVNTMYPGRGSASPILDLLITLLHWGAAGWRAQLDARESLFQAINHRLGQFAAMHGERVLHTPGNPISLGLTLQSLSSEGRAMRDAVDDGEEKQRRGVTFLGSMLFTRCASGARVVARGARQTVAGIEFVGYGAHCDAYPEDYLTIAAALGTRVEDVTEFLSRLGKCMAMCRATRPPL